jgi:hypothetical protein
MTGMLHLTNNVILSVLFKNGVERRYTVAKGLEDEKAKERRAVLISELDAHFASAGAVSWYYVGGQPTTTSAPRFRLADVTEYFVELTIS